jgi:hypothetical protein
VVSKFAFEFNLHRYITATLIKHRETLVHTEDYGEFDPAGAVIDGQEYRVRD